MSVANYSDNLHEHEPIEQTELSLRAPGFGARNLLFVDGQGPISRCARDDKSPREPLYCVEFLGE